MLFYLFILLLMIISYKCINTNNEHYKKSSNVIIGGTAKNCGKYLPTLFEKFKSLESMHSVYYIFFENDSSDDTKEQLSKFLVGRKGKLLTEIDLKQKIKEGRFRTHLLAYGRNKIIEHIETENLDKHCDFFINLDLDDVNIHLNTDSVNRCLNEYNTWDIASLNKQGRYYDLWALRTNAKTNNCWYKDACTKHSLKKWFPNTDLKDHIPLDYPKLKVTSAFGGLTIYKTYLLRGHRYVNDNDCTFENCEHEDCEHVRFHESILKQYPRTRFYIVPYMYS